MPEILPIDISPMTPLEIPVCLDIHEAAFASDQCSNLLNAGRLRATYAKRMRPAIDGWFHNGRHLIKATDKETGSIVGWATWSFHWYEDEKKGNGDEAEVPEEGEGGDSITEATVTPDKLTKIIPQQLLVQRIDANQTKAKANWMSSLSDKKHMSLDALAVLPTYQSRGVGSALVRWGTEQADVRGVSCWIDVSPAGAGVYARAGFREIGGDDYDLSEFAPGGKKGKRGWGIYRFMYMIREARRGKE
ncbi:hypothetical protein MMC14_008609 [Varicellaria rhodocarpa]|nr:hypothetical protein [Varicellaria rhodocarpa]